MNDTIQKRARLSFAVLTALWIVGLLALYISGISFSWIRMLVYGVLILTGMMVYDSSLSLRWSHWSKSALQVILIAVFAVFIVAVPFSETAHYAVNLSGALAAETIWQLAILKTVHQDD